MAGPKVSFNRRFHCTIIIIIIIVIIIFTRSANLHYLVMHIEFISA